MKKFLASLIVAIVCLALSAPPALAGSKQRRRWEGVAIGIGAAILGHAILNNHDRRDARRPAVVRHERRPYYSSPRYSAPPPRQCRRGQWEIRKVWVPPTYKEVWNPGHYNRKRNWVPGKWIKIIDQEGHWTEEEVWVGRR